MERSIFYDVRCLNAYLTLLFGSPGTAAAHLSSYLDQLIVQSGPIPSLAEMLAELHARIDTFESIAFPTDGLTERERALNWRLRDLTVQERAMVLLGSIAGTERVDGARILGLTQAAFQRDRALILGRLRNETAIVMSRQAIIAMDLRTIVGGLGVMSVKVATGFGDLSRLLDAGRPAVVVADTSGLPAEALADCLEGRARHAPIPAVVISADMQRTTLFRLSLPKPYSPAMLRSAVLQAIGA